MERLTKKNPGTNLERLLNFAIAKDKQVVLDYGFEKKPLVQVVVEKAKEIGCDASEQAVMWEGQCMECDCAVALMNMLAVQAAELHARLSKIEDILGDDYDLDRLAAIMNQRMSMREDVAERWKLTSGIPIDRLRELAQADREGRCVVHCNDCRWGQMDDLGIMHCHKYHMHKNVDGFCDEGERKEPENENTYSSI